MWTFAEIYSEGAIFFISGGGKDPLISPTTTTKKSPKLPKNILLAPLNPLVNAQEQVTIVKNLLRQFNFKFSQPRFVNANLFYQLPF